MFGYEPQHIRFQTRLACFCFALFAAAISAPVSHAEERITYSEHIAPLLDRFCVQCHRPGEVAPMSLLTYAQVRPWARSILEQVSSKKMPPFFASGPLGRYKNDLRLSEAEIALVRDWVLRGTPEGKKLPPPPPEPSKSGWRSGEPDLVIRFPRHKLEPSTKDPYVYLFGDCTFEEETWVRGYEWQFSDYDVAHHAIAFRLGPDFEIPPSRRIEGLDVPVDVIAGMADWLPGAGPELFPQGSARIIPAGTRVVSVFHYSPPATETWDEPKLGIYFADGDIDKLYRRLNLVTKDISIPPGKPDYTKRLTKKFERDAYVTGFNVHMHYRGKTAKISFQYPDGTKEPVFELPKFDFNWQREYVLKEPLLVPAGTEAEFIGTWDNSADNPYNPDPTIRVEHGVLSENEMGNANISYYDAKGPKEPYPVTRGHLPPDYASPYIDGIEQKLSSEAGLLKESIRTMPQEKYERLLKRLPQDKKAVVEALRRQSD